MSVFLPRRLATTAYNPLFVCVERKSAMNNMCPPFVPRDKLEVWTVVHMAFIIEVLRKSHILYIPNVSGHCECEQHFARNKDSKCGLVCARTNHKL